MKIRLTILLGLLVLLGAFWGVATVQRKGFERELAPLAQRFVAEVKSRLDASPLGAEGYAMAHEVTVSRAYLVAGPVVGKVTVYTRPNVAAGEGTVHAYEYHLTYDDGVWEKQDSAFCAEKACRVRGAALIDAAP